MGVDLTRRQAAWLIIAGFLLVVLVTPLAAIYAVDYRMVESRMQPGFAGQEVAYGSLDPAVQAAVDDAMAGDGPWYRTRGGAPFDPPLVVVRRGDALAFTLAPRFHWTSWRGKMPAVTGLVGVACVGTALVDRIRKAGAVPG